MPGKVRSSLNGRDETGAVQKPVCFCLELRLRHQKD